MIIKKEFYNIKCDCCGQTIDEQYWDEPEAVEQMLDECGWKAMENGRHYCHDCWEWDDDDCQEIMTHRMSYMEVGEWMTLTQFHAEMIRCKALYQSMVGQLYKGMLADDLREADVWFGQLLAQRKGTPEWDCYHTFLRHGIFKRFENDTYDRLYQK